MATLRRWVVAAFTALIAAASAAASSASPAADAPDAVAPAWSQLPPPGGLYGSAMTVDTRRKRALVFGGSDQFVSHAEVWTAKLDGPFAWSRLPVPLGPGPSPREGARVFYDEARDRLLMFGGISPAGYFGELWELSLGDSLRWRPVDATGPAPRAFASMVLDSRRQRLLVYGGFGDGVIDLGDVWAFSLVGPPIWTRLDTPEVGPGPRSRHAAIYDPIQDRMVVFGGNVNELPRNDVWSLKLADGPSWSAMNPPPLAPTPRCGHSATYDAERGRMVVFGGYDTFYASDTWSLSLAGGSWERLSIPNAPRGRLDHAAAFDEANRRVVVFGGFNSEDGYLNDVWFLGFDGPGSWSQANSTGILRPRWNHGAVYDAGNDRMVIFGGMVAGNNGNNVRTDAWALSLDDHPKWSAMAPNLDFPSLRSGAAVAYDTRRWRMLGFGGQGENFPLNDVFALNLPAPVTWSTILPANAKPSARAYASAVYDSLRDRVVIFGGRSATAPVNDVWELSLAGTPAWNPPVVNGTKPSARDLPVFVLDPVHDRAIVFGGIAPGTGAGRIDAWQLSLAPPMTWTRINPDNNPPVRRSYQSGAWDIANNRLIVFGGTDSMDARSEVWALSLEGTPHWTVLAPPGDPPGKRLAATAIYDARRSRLVVFGGMGSFSGLLNDTWALPLGAPSPGPTLEAPFPSRVALGARAFPNPAHGELRVEFTVPRASVATVAVFDLEGRAIARLANGSFAAGTHTVAWNRRTAEGRRVRPGVYYLSIAAAGERIARRVVLVE